MSQHTPGPWKVAHGSIGSMKGHNLATSDGRIMVGFVHGINAGSTANARLIAQAPAMREALELIRQNWDDAGRHAARVDAILQAIDGPGAAQRREP